MYYHVELLVKPQCLYTVKWQICLECLPLIWFVLVVIQKEAKAELDF